jgi:hypothetical protein
LIIEVGLGAVGAEANDAVGPGAGDAGNLHKLIE